VIDRVPVEAGGSHQGMAFSPDGTRLYAVNYGAGTVSVVDAWELRVLKRLMVGDRPTNIIVAGAAGH
jgi:YVTN family beta-propeller protein